MNNRIQIKIKDTVVVNGRQQEQTKPYYRCWCEALEVYGQELYQAINSKHENVLYFKVRYCKKINDMRRTNKEKFVVKFEDVDYEVFYIDFKRNSKDWVYIKAKMVI